MSNGNKFLEMWLSGAAGKIAVVLVLLGVGPLGWVCLAGIAIYYFLKMKN